MKSERQQTMAAAAFAKRWQGRGYEKGESQTFWIEILAEIFDFKTYKVHLEETLL